MNKIQPSDAAPGDLFGAESVFEQEKLTEHEFSILFSTDEVSESWQRELASSCVFVNVQKILKTRFTGGVEADGRAVRGGTGIIRRREWQGRAGYERGCP